MFSVKCFLRCVADSHPPISLPHFQDVVLGRCPTTKIIDKRCSKNQLTFRADTVNKTVQVRQTGPNMSAVNGVPLRVNGVRVAHHGDTVHFLLGQYEHIVEFDPKPETNSKRQVERNEPSSSKKICGDSSHAPMTTSPQRLVDQNKWESIKGGQLLVYESQGIKHSNKIAAYDMDGTIITTKSGKVFPQHSDDWKILWPDIPSKLQKLHTDGFKIVIFTNQAGISRGKTTASEMKRKIEQVVSKLNVPVQAFVATGDSIFRKPAPGMWDFLASQGNGGVSIDMSKCVYCGDAAGRPENWAPKKKKDFSCSDRLFARNLGLTFVTPEEHFLGQKSVPFVLPDFNPAVVPKTDAELLDPPGTELTLSQRELILMVGFPGSGKSFFCREHIIPAGYAHVNRDTLGSWQKCVAATKSALDSGKSVVVDNTNVDLESRQRYIEIAKKLLVPCRCFITGDSAARARHNNKFRELIGEIHEPISEMIMNSHKSKYKEPQLSEGFSEIVRVNFKPKFANGDHERLYKMYLLDKY